MPNSRSPEKAVVLLSGGLDSTLALYWGRNKYSIIRCLTFDYGQRAAKKEKEAAQYFSRLFGLHQETLTLPWLKKITRSSLVDRETPLPHLVEAELDDLQKTVPSAKAVWVPNRNGLFLNIAACYAESLGASVILAGFNREEAKTFPDNSEAFIDHINQTLSYSTLSTVRVECIARSMSKKEILREALRAEIDLNKLWSCYEGSETPCGRCESCLRFARALGDSR